MRRRLEWRHNPLAFFRDHWPQVNFWDRQKEIVLSVRDNDETYVPAAHKVGKDFVAAGTVLWFFSTRHPVRVVTTSVKDDHLRVLWGEIGRFLDTAARPLAVKDGGDLLVSHREIKKVVSGKVCKISYLIGTVSEKGEGMAGHHAPHTLLVVDEASGVDDLVYERGMTWAKRLLVIGNPYPTNNFFFKAVEGGDVVAP